MEPEPADAAVDVPSPRGEQPEWPEAEEEIELAYRGPAVSHLLLVQAEPSALDVHFNIDTTGSIHLAIDELQAALRSDIIQPLRARVPDIAFGVSRFADFPVPPFGGTGEGDMDPDKPYVLLSPITTDIDRVINAVAKLDRPLDYGADLSEASAEALYQVATGAGFVVGSHRYIERGPKTAAVGGGTVGGVGFRSQALHVVLHVGDSPSHEPEDYAEGDLPGTRSLEQATSALREIGARVISIIPSICEDQKTEELREACRTGYPYAPTRQELSALAINTGARTAAERGSCPTGIAQAPLPAYDGTCPLVYDVRGDGSGLSRTISDAVLAMLEQVRFGEVHAEASNDRLGFVRELRAEAVRQPSGVAQPELRDRLPLPPEKPDGVADSFLQVERRSQLGFRVTLRNDRIAPSDLPQRFRIAIRVVGDGVLLQERLLRVLVPAGHVTGDDDLDAGR
ncbi:MAG TPA: hypothetical protein VJV78_43490 [Polyangiales bacterium]|nr:hypothetical protein [Polyangiales bacterium]